MKIPQYLILKRSKSTKSFQKELWDEIWNETSFEKLVNQLTINPIYWRLKKLINKSDSILEAGCGFGQWVYRLSNQGYKVTGVDTAKRTIRQIKKLQPSLDIGLGDVENLPLMNSSFSVYLSFGVIEHFEKGPEKVLDEAYRVLKTNGLLFLTVPYLNLLRFIKYKISNPKSGNFYQYLYSESEILKKIENSGFKIFRTAHYDFLSAIRRDANFLFKLLIKGRRSNEFMNTEVKKINQYLEKEPNFFWQHLLYKIDSYILLIEARKVKK